MKYPNISLLAGVGLIIVTTCAEAGKDAKLENPLTAKAKVALSDSFDGKALAKKWTANKGDWQINDGAIVGKELASDKHAAVLTLGEPNKDSVIQFSFNLDGAKGFNLSFNHAKGHLFRVLINPDGVVVNKDKDKKDPKSETLKLGEAKGAFAKGQWHTIQVAVRGGDVLVKADNGIDVHASHAGLNVAKTGYRFVTRGESVLIDDLTVWRLK